MVCPCFRAQKSTRMFLDFQDFVFVIFFYIYECRVISHCRLQTFRICFFPGIVVRGDWAIVYIHVRHCQSIMVCPCFRAQKSTRMFLDFQDFVFVIFFYIYECRVISHCRLQTFRICFFPGIVVRGDWAIVYIHVRHCQSIMVCPCFRAQKSTRMFSDFQDFVFVIFFYIYECRVISHCRLQTFCICFFSRIAVRGDWAIVYIRHCQSIMVCPRFRAQNSTRMFSDFQDFVFVIFFFSRFLAGYHIL